MNNLIVTALGAPYLIYTWMQVKFVQDKGIDVGGKELLIILQVCSLVARMCFGPVADIAIIRTHRIMIQQVCFIIMSSFIFLHDKSIR